MDLHRIALKIAAGGTFGNTEVERKILLALTKFRNATKPLEVEIGTGDEMFPESPAVSEESWSLAWDGNAKSALRLQHTIDREVEEIEICPQAQLRRQVNGPGTKILGLIQDDVNAANESESIED